MWRPEEEFSECDISESQFIDRELKKCIQDSGRAQNLVVTCNFPLVPPSFGCGLSGGCVGVVTGAVWPGKVRHPRPPSSDWDGARRGGGETRGTMEPVAHRSGGRWAASRRGEQPPATSIGQCQQLSWCCRGSSSVTSRPCLSSPLATCHSSTSSLHTTLTLFRAQLHKDPTPVRRGSEQAVPNPEIDWVYKLSVTNSSIMAVVTSRQTVCPNNTPRSSKLLLVSLNPWFHTHTYSISSEMKTNFVCFIN